jgi:hypothetical protein
MVRFAPCYLVSHADLKHGVYELLDQVCFAALREKTLLIMPVMGVRRGGLRPFTEDYCSW